MEANRLGDLAATKLNEIGDYLGDRLDVGKTSDILQKMSGSLERLNNPYEVASEVFEAMKGFSSNQNLQSFAEAMAAAFLPQLDHTVKTFNVDNPQDYLKAMRTVGERVPEEYRAPMWMNMGLPLIHLFAKDAGGYEDALSRINEVPLNKYTEWSKKRLWGETLGEGTYRLLDTISSMDNPQFISHTLAELLATISNPKRKAFLEKTGPELFTALARFPPDERENAVRKVLTMDRKASESNLLPPWEFIRLYAPTVLNAAADSKNPREALNTEGDRILSSVREILSADETVQHQSMLIDSPESLNTDTFNNIRREVLAAKGWVDVIVHPHTSQNWIRPEDGEFESSFQKRTGRTIEDYREYEKQLDDFMKSDSNLKIILYDPDKKDDTLVWVNDISPKGSVWLIPAVPADQPNAATPYVNHVQYLMDRAGDIQLLREMPPQQIPPSEDPWNPLANVFKKLGVIGVRVGGEFAFSPLVHGEPTQDSEDNMNIRTGCSVEQAHGNLLPYFNAKVLNQICFPHSTALKPVPSESSEEERFSPTLFERIPGDIRGTVQTLCSNAYWSVISLGELFEIMDKPVKAYGGSADPYAETREELKEHINRLKINPQREYTGLFNHALVLSRKLPDPRERVTRIVQTLESLVQLKETKSPSEIETQKLQDMRQATTIEALNKTVKQETG